jgi:hypothetical protein
MEYKLSPDPNLSVERKLRLEAYSSAPRAEIVLPILATP